MFIRCGHFIGTVADQVRPRFDATLRDEILPLLRRLPKIVGARILWARDHEPNAPRLYATIELAFRSAEDLAAALASPAREAVRERFAALRPLFEGEVSHVHYTVDTAA